MNFSHVAFIKALGTTELFAIAALVLVFLFLRYRLPTSNPDEITLKSSILVSSSIPSILLALTLIALAASSAVYMLKNITSEAKHVRVKSDLESISTALSMYKILARRNPTTEQGLSALVERPVLEPVPERWRRLLESIPSDTWGRPYLYRSPASHSHNSYDLFSAGPDGLMETEDDIGNW